MSTSTKRKAVDEDRSSSSSDESEGAVAKRGKVTPSHITYPSSDDDDDRDVDLDKMVDSAVETLDNAGVAPTRAVEMIHDFYSAYFEDVDSDYGAVIAGLFFRRASQIPPFKKEAMRKLIQTACRKDRLQFTTMSAVAKIHRFLSCALVTALTCLQQNEKHAELFGMISRIRVSPVEPTMITVAGLLEKVYTPGFSFKEKTVFEHCSRIQCSEANHERIALLRAVKKAFNSPAHAIKA